ncbi:ABC transporter substrate-binding protein [Aquincola sp. S2]|uniref:ABC transporter substrate-binding protein n=1 Tax=Pseudaquabacterium terrae TaxID=2732868 RepID=A0ABX2EEN8_9BURK|nr:ABC transporter substrate-binding protein [Aquabacterium terrae]
MHVKFLDRLHERGWIEGTNLVVDMRYAGGRSEPLPALAAELVALRPDLMVTAGTTPTRALRDATSTIPIVMAGGGDPVGSGLVQSLARPGGNITGVSLLGQEIIPKALSLLHEVVPQARRIDLLGNAANPANQFFAKSFSDAARARGLDSHLLEIRSVDEIAPAIAAARADALLCLPDPMFAPNARRIADAAIERRLPLANTGGRLYTTAGSLFSYSVNDDDVWQLAAVYADRILRGAKPAEMPIEQPSRYELIINLKTAKALGLTIPQSVLLRADELMR